MYQKLLLLREYRELACVLEVDWRKICSKDLGLAILERACRSKVGSYVHVESIAGSQIARFRQTASVASGKKSQLHEPVRHEEGKHTEFRDLERALAPRHV